MKNQNRPYPRVQEEKNVIDAAHRGARRGTVAGAASGALAGAMLGGKKRKIAGLIGGAAGSIAGNQIGRKVGAATGARDVQSARRALQEMCARLDALDERAVILFDRNGNAIEPGLSGQHPVPIFPKSKRPDIQQTGIDDEGDYVLIAQRDALAEVYGRGIVDALTDAELSKANCRRLRAQVLGRQAKANGPAASSNCDPDFERNALVIHLGAKAVDAMTPAEIHCHFLSAQRRGLIDFQEGANTVDFEILNRERTPSGTFAPKEATDPLAIQRAYSRHNRRTGIETGSGVAAGAGLVGAIAHLRGRKSKLPRMNPRTIDVPATTFAMTSCAGPGKYPIKRRALRGKLPPGVPKITTGQNTSLAFLIQDDDFPLVPQKIQKLGPGTKRRVPLAKSRAEVLKRLKAITALCRHDFGLGAIAAEGIIDAATNPVAGKKKKLTIDANGNAVNPQFLKDPGTTSTSSLSAALSRLNEFGMASGLLKDGAVIAGADLSAEEIHDVLSRARDKKKGKLQVKGGIEAQSPSGPTALSLRSVLTEFDADGAQDKARKRAGELGAAGIGGAAGAIGGLKYDQGSPVHPKDVRPGDVLYRRFGPGGVLQHHGAVGSDGRVTHRTRGSDSYRSIKPESFRKVGKGPTYREKPDPKMPRAKAATNATRAAGTTAGKYRVGTNDCQTASSRLATRRVPGTGQLRRAGIGAAIGAAGAGTVAAILNHRKDTNGRH